MPGRGGVAGAAPAGGRRAPALLRPPDGGAPGDRVRVRRPAGVRDVDQGRRAPPHHRRRPEARRRLTAVVEARRRLVTAQMHRGGHVASYWGSHSHACGLVRRWQALCSDSDAGCWSHLLTNSDWLQ